MEWTKQQRQTMVIELEGRATPKIDLANSPWGCETNWIIASGGSLEDLITYESTTFSINEEVQTSSSFDSTHNKPSVVLTSPGPDSGFCEIKINFTQSHELRQIYVRSTARVYEVYSAYSLQNSNEYLCTVRCCVAVRDGEVLQTPDIPQSSVQCKCSDTELTEECFMNEEEWVEVKPPETNEAHFQNISGPLKTLKHLAKRKMDLHEATVEVEDGNPCISLTIRLLSLQSKDSVYIDEVYVFADPVDSPDSISEDNRVENSSANSLMAMFLPTILQLSKTTGVSHVNDKHFDNNNEKEALPNIESLKTTSTNSGTKPGQELKSIVTQSQESKLEKMNGEDAGKSQSPLQVDAPATQLSSGDFLLGYLEKTMESLFSRMDKIENICIGFQEQMLQPITQMEKRLQQVEQKLEILGDKLKNCESQSSSKVYDADACSNSEPRSSSRIAEDIVSQECERAEKDDGLEASSIPHVDMSDSNATQLVPFINVKAPEFLNCDDEEDHSRLELSTNSSNDVKRQSLSIDVALSSAFEGFLSSISVGAPRYVQALNVKAPDFSIEEGILDKDDTSPGVQCGSEKIGSICFNGSERNVGTEGPISLDIHVGGEMDVADCVFEERPIRAADVTPECYVDETTNATEDLATHSIALEGGDSVTDCLIGEEYGKAANKTCSKSGEGCKDVGGTGTVTVHHEVVKSYFDCGDSDNIESLIGGESQVNQCQTDCNSDGNKAEVIALNSTASAIKASHQDILQNVLGFFHPPSVIDFERPLLEVKFMSNKKLNTQPPLETLLFGMEHAIQASPVDDDYTNTNPSNKFALYTDGEPANTATDGEAESPAISVADLNLVEIPVGINDEKLPEYHAVGKPIFHDDLPQMAPREDAEQANSGISNHVLVDMNYCNLVDVPVGIPTEDVAEQPSCRSGDMVTSSLL